MRDLALEKETTVAFDVMIDLETLGTDPGCVVLSIGAVVFGPSGTGAEFHRVLSVDQQVKAGMRIDPDTHIWWEQQSDDAKKTLLEAHAKEDRLIYDLIDFSVWVESTVGLGRRANIWGNGAEFDNSILGALYKKMGLKKPWAYGESRCYRTLKNLRQIDLPTRPEGNVFHNALDDARLQAQHAVALLNDIKPWWWWTAMVQR